MVDEYDVITLAVGLPEFRLIRGSIGVALLVYEDGAFEVEFLSPGGVTLAVTTLYEGQYRVATEREIASWREGNERATPGD